MSTETLHHNFHLSQVAFIFEKDNTHRSHRKTFCRKQRQCVIDIKQVWRTNTHLFREVFGSQEEAQQASNNHGQHWQDEEAVLLAHILHTAPHRTQRHGDLSASTCSISHTPTLTQGYKRPNSNIHEDEVKDELKNENPAVEKLAM